MTIVAAWIRAETGVGPAIASASHTCRGTWALLPMAPMKSSKAAVVATVRVSASPLGIASKKALRPTKSRVAPPWFMV
ncbi:hypothetical protein D3C86_1352700 [compost metagenome]